MSSTQSGSINLTPAMIANIRATMCNIEGLTVNWAGVREMTGVSSNGNAAQGFRNAMKAFGLKVVDTKNWTFGDENDEAPAVNNIPATPAKKRGRPKKAESPEAKRKKMATPKKDAEVAEEELKLEDGAGEQDGEVTQA